MPAEQTIFIVDDDEMVRDSLAALLKAAGLDVKTYGSARDFLKDFSAPQSGCLLLDVSMPEMDGLELQRELAARKISLPVIIITGHGDVPLAVKAMKAGALDFIEKPHVNEVILDCIQHALERSAAARRAESSAEGAAGRLALLTPREREVLEHLVAGRQNKVIGHEMGISPRTVEIHRARVMAKMRARHLSHLVRIALAAGIDPSWSPPSREDALGRPCTPATKTE